MFDHEGTFLYFHSDLDMDPFVVVCNVVQYSYGQFYYFNRSFTAIGGYLSDSEFNTRDIINYSELKYVR